MIELFSCEARRQIRSIVSLCEEFGVRCTRAKRANQNDFTKMKNECNFKARKALSAEHT